MFKKLETTEKTRKKIASKDFQNGHKRKPTDFSRKRFFKFTDILSIILRKSVKSVQLVLNELFMQNILTSTVSSSAYTQARKKFRHTAFIELNDLALEIYYSDDNIKLWKGYRMIGMDGSKIILPNTKDVEKEFGRTKIKNQSMNGSYVAATYECAYDVLNHMTIANTLAPGASYEVDLAIPLLENFKENDLCIFDRGYASFKFLATLISANKTFIVRCPTSSFKATESLFKNEDGTWSKIAILKAPNDQRKLLEELGLPLEITVRFVSVVLCTGEVEVLATSIMNPHFARDDFKEAYGLRWGVEDYFEIIKERLNLENFTGKSAETVRQDFWSTIYISNLETIYSEDTEKEMNAELKEGQLKKNVNKAVSFNAIKNMAFELLFSEDQEGDVTAKLDKLFKTKTNVERPNRMPPPRRERSMIRSYNYSKRIKKQVF